MVAETVGVPAMVAKSTLSRISRENSSISANEFCSTGKMFWYATTRFLVSTVKTTIVNDPNKNCRCSIFKMFSTCFDLFFVTPDEIPICKNRIQMFSGVSRYRSTRPWTVPCSFLLIPPSGFETHWRSSLCRVATRSLEGRGVGLVNWRTFRVRRPSNRSRGGGG